MLGVPLSKIDKTRYYAQLRAVISWKWSGARNTILACTGLGKTFIAFLTIKKMEKIKII